MSFAGKITMFGGEVRNIEDCDELKELISCGYVEALDAPISSETTKDTASSKTANAPAPKPKGRAKK